MFSAEWGFGTIICQSEDSNEINDRPLCSRQHHLATDA